MTADGAEQPEAGWPGADELRHAAGQRERLRQLDAQVADVEERALRLGHSLARWERDAERTAQRLEALSCLAGFQRYHLYK